MNLESENPGYLQATVIIRSSGTTSVSNKNRGTLVFLPAYPALPVLQPLCT